MAGSGERRIRHSAILSVDPQVQHLPEEQPLCLHLGEVCRLWVLPILNQTQPHTAASAVGTPRGLSPQLPINSWGGALPQTCHVSLLTQARGGWGRSWHVRGLGGGGEVATGILNRVPPALASYEGGFWLLRARTLKLGELERREDHFGEQERDLSLDTRRGQCGLVAMCVLWHKSSQLRNIHQQHSRVQLWACRWLFPIQPLPPSLPFLLICPDGSSGLKCLCMP